MNFADTKEYLTSREFRPSKKMGQNFLINQEISKNIVNSIDFKNVDLVIEIGPGLGALTDYLIDKKFNLVLVELDKRLNEFLIKRYKNKKVEIINSDVLKVDFDKLVEKHRNPIIISNLPYSISSLVLVKFLKCKNIKEIYCMLQQEMVDRISSPVGSKKYNSFTVLVQFYAEVNKICKIGPNNFLPAPEVDSLFISIKKNKKQFNLLFDKFLRNCFLNRRKTLINNLKNQYDIKAINFSLEKMNIQKLIRPEELPPDQLFAIFNYLNN